MNRILSSAFIEVFQPLVIAALRKISKRIFPSFWLWDQRRPTVVPPSTTKACPFCKRTAIVLSNPSVGVSGIGPCTPDVPALLTKMLTGPSVSSTFSRAGCSCPRAVTSTLIAEAGRPGLEARPGRVGSSLCSAPELRPQLRLELGPRRCCGQAVLQSHAFALKTTQLYSRSKQ
jgi:hypothetical protein